MPKDSENVPRLSIRLDSVLLFVTSREILGELICSSCSDGRFDPDWSLSYIQTQKTHIYTVKKNSFYKTTDLLPALNTAELAKSLFLMSPLLDF